ncbi:aryl-sulfate sulfotransferase [Alphaproteobacteria bacterium 46_93_T64]|nr:aryl-sulfate sulfotransferase [Alphaproteobacteria bacterium 46_93_T64]
MTDDIVKHSVSISGHRTSVSLEREFWDLFCQAAESRNISINALIAELDENRTGNLSSAIRLFVLHEVQQQADG